MESRNYLKVLRRFWRSSAGVTLLAVVAALTLTLLATPTYTARTALMFSATGATSAGDLVQGSDYTSQQVASYVELASSRIVLQPVIDGLKLGVTPAQLARDVSVTVPTGTTVLWIQVSHSDPQMSEAIASRIADELVGAVARLSPAVEGGAGGVRATVITPAAVPSDPTSPKLVWNLTLGLVVGLLVGIGQALLRDVLDPRVRSVADVKEITDTRVIGALGFEGLARDHPVVVRSDPTSPRAEAFRRVRTNLHLHDVGERGNRGRTCVITSPTASEGKTTVAVNTAAAIADGGQTVLLIDADLHRPMVANFLGLEETTDGLTTVLSGRTTLGDVVQDVGDGLHVLPSGRIPPNPSDLLESARMEALVAEAASLYDFIVIDTPPLLPVTDAAIVARITAGAILVVASSEVTRVDVGAALQTLDDADAEALGIIVNKLRVRPPEGISAKYFAVNTSGARQADPVDGEASTLRRSALPAAPARAVINDTKEIPGKQ